MIKKLLIAAILSAILLAIVMNQPQTEVEYNPASAKLCAALMYAGIKSLTDVSDERAIIIFNLPEHMSEEESVHCAMEVAAEMTDSRKIVVRVCENYIPLREYVVDREEYSAFMKGEKTFEELETLRSRTFG